MPCWKADGVRLQRAARGSAGRVSGWIFPSGTRAPSARKAAGTERGLRAGGGGELSPAAPGSAPHAAPGGAPAARIARHGPARPGGRPRGASGPGSRDPAGEAPRPDGEGGGRRRQPCAGAGARSKGLLPGLSLAKRPLGAPAAPPALPRRGSAEVLVDGGEKMPSESPSALFILRQAINIASPLF